MSHKSYGTALTDYQHYEATYAPLTSCGWRLNELTSWILRVWRRQASGACGAGVANSLAHGAAYHSSWAGKLQVGGEPLCSVGNPRVVYDTTRMCTTLEAKRIGTSSLSGQHKWRRLFVCSVRLCWPLMYSARIPVCLMGLLTLKCLSPWSQPQPTQ